jgi:hypothetical protein
MKAPATKKQVADRLRMSLRGTDYRLGQTIDLGYVVNQETRARQPAKLVPGDLLPEERPALPTVEQVLGEWGAHPGDNGRHFAMVEETQTQPESEGIVAKTTAKRFTTNFATSPTVDSDSKMPSEEAPWRSGETDSRETYPPPSNTNIDDLDGDIEDGVL